MTLQLRQQHRPGPAGRRRRARGRAGHRRHDLMDVAAGRRASPARSTPFATNVLVAGDPAGQPAGHRVARRPRGRRRWVRCADDAPCGKVAARRCWTRHGVTAEPASLEVDVRAILAKVTSGEADAGLVYATDAVAAGDARARRCQIPEAAGRADDLRRWRPSSSPGTPTWPRAWVDLVLSDEGRPVAARTPASACPAPRRDPRPPGPSARGAGGAGRPRGRSCSSCRSSRWSPRTAGRSFPRQLGSGPLREALRLSRRHLDRGDARAACVLGLPLAWLLARVDFRGRAAPARRWSPSRWCCRPWSPASPCATPSGATGVIGGRCWTRPASRSPSPPAGVVAGPRLRLDAVLRAQRRGRAALRRARSTTSLAATLGATRWTTFRRVTLPLALPGVLAGMVLAWARSLGEFGATITFAGNYPGTTQTMPTLIYADPAVRPGGRAAR